LPTTVGTITCAAVSPGVTGVLPALDATSANPL